MAKELVLRPRETALVVHDMENVFWKAPYADPSKAERMIPGIQRLLAAAREYRMPVVYTVYVHGPQGLESSTMNQRLRLGNPDRFTEGSHAVQIIDELAPQPGDVVVKKFRYSAFYETGLERKLRRLGVENLVLTGGSSNWGVEALARDAEYRDFIPVAVSDCTVGTTPAQHEAFLANMRLFIGYARTCDEVVELLAEGAAAQGSS